MAPNVHVEDTAASAWKDLEKIAVEVQHDLDVAHIDRSNEFASIIDLWKRMLPNGTESDTWYSSAKRFWDDESTCSLNENGVLGGYAEVSEADIFDSTQFLKYVNGNIRPHCEAKIAVDCGAGIGRVTKFLLLPNFEHVDLVEQSSRLLEHVPRYIGDKETTRLGNSYCVALQDFHPTPNFYDVIWIQWVLLYLTDIDLVYFLRRCQRALKPHGWICIKENVILDKEQPFVLDQSDLSLTRCDAYYKSIFKQARLQIIFEQRQLNFPAELFPVKMYALQ
uniref:Alpha N-terminal protein methyltransferase 1 n=1 Tax=Albugo laibachii Nc14 TaxID=890382 RepID=F0W6E3_9STRA|nr:conserved hypothetical protein [Albugo laibachii Nc14]|eukprot:CCA16687.1 conserved hypothetical protein [Albugo laibachii Nc14]